MSSTQLAPMTQWITEAVLQHGPALPMHVMDRLGVSRRRANLLLRKLQAMQWLKISGSPRKPQFAPGELRQVVRRYSLAGLQEDLPWRRDFAPCLALPAPVQRMAQHAFTELLNNAVDHSGGSLVTVSMRQTPVQLQLLLSDNGCGLFSRIAQSFAIDEPLLAMLELSKGKLTSAPEQHLGHGLFFVSRLADVFDIHADGAAFQSRHWEPQRWHAGRPVVAGGTSVYLAIALDTPRTLDSVLRAHSGDGAGYGFERTVVPLHLLASQQALASRADARRVASRLQQFAHAELDFSGIDEIGHGFADELFRVFRQQHPNTQLVPLGANAQVSAMLASIGG